MHQIEDPVCGMCGVREKKRDVSVYLTGTIPEMVSVFYPGISPIQRKMANVPLFLPN